MRTGIMVVACVALAGCSAGHGFVGDADAGGGDTTLADAARDAFDMDGAEMSADVARNDASNDAGAEGAVDGGDGGPMCSGSGVDPYPMDSAPGEYTDPPTCMSPPCPDTFQSFSVMPNADNSVATVTGFSPHALTCSFVVVSASCGVETGTLGLDPDTGTFSGQVPLFCGNNIVKIICSAGAYHRIHVVNVPGRMCEGDDLRLTLTWDSNVRDGELHLIRMPSQINDATNDCTWTTCIPPRVLDWGVAGDTTDNPVKDVDNVSTNGTEHITLTRAPAGTYAIMSEHWNTGGVTGAMTMEINVQGRAPIVRSVPAIAAHWVWYVGLIQFPGGTFTPSDAMMSPPHTPPLTDCTASWTFPGCGLAIPQ